MGVVAGICCRSPAKRFVNRVRFPHSLLCSRSKPGDTSRLGCALGDCLLAYCTNNCQWYNLYMKKIREHHPLALLFMLATLAYGIGFILARFTDVLGTSSLYITMTGIHPYITLIWGVVCVLAVIHTAAGFRFASLLGFMAWVFAGICYVIAGNWLVLVAVALPNMLYWLWQNTHH